MQVLSPDAHAALAEIIASVVAVSPHSQAASKAIVRSILDGTLDDDPASTAFDDAFDGPDFAEGAAAFLAKRPPRFGA